MSPVAIVIMLLVFGAAVLFVQGLYWAYEIFRGEKSSELSRRIGGGQAAAPRVELLGERERPGSGGVAAQLQDMLLQAGEPWDMQGLVLRIVGSGVATALALAWIAGVAQDPSTAPVKLAGILIFAALAAGLPLLQLKRKIRERTDQITEKLPEALDLMARSLRAGHGVSEAMRMVSTELPPPISAEFGRVYEEHNLGVDFREALQHMVERNKANFDLRIFVSSVLLQRETGGNLIEILEQIAGTIRERFVFYGKVRTLTAESRISAIILGTIPFFVGLAIAVLRPSYLLPLYTDTAGQIVSVTGALWFCLGIFVLYELTKIEV